jgi:hypothetical protein
METERGPEQCGVGKKVGEMLTVSFADGAEGEGVILELNGMRLTTRIGVLF